MKYFSVTTCLQPFFPTGIPRDLLDAACERGKRVHGACESYAQGIPVMGLPEELQGYFQSFKAWFDAYVDHVFFVELQLEDPILCFTGRPDLGVRLIDGWNLVVDLKTPLAESPTWKMQLAGYLHLVRAGYVIPDGEWNGAMSLRLRPGGQPAKASTYEEDRRDFTAFLSALNVYRYIN